MAVLIVFVVGVSLARLRSVAMCKQNETLCDQIREAALREVEFLRAIQKADNVLNHILKNTMADVSGCIDLFMAAQSLDMLIQVHGLLTGGPSAVLNIHHHMLARTQSHLLSN